VIEGVIEKVMEEQNEKPWLVYIIETERNTFYTGITNDLKSRWQAHLNGKGAKYTRSHKPKRIVFTEQQTNRSEATKREAQIKKLKRQEKLVLIANSPFSESFN
jgi:putative endonuclease